MSRGSCAQRPGGRERPRSPRRLGRRAARAAQHCLNRRTPEKSLSKARPANSCPPAGGFLKARASATRRAIRRGIKASRHHHPISSPSEAPTERTFAGACRLTSPYRSERGRILCFMRVVSIHASFGLPAFVCSLLASRSRRSPGVPVRSIRNEPGAPFLRRTVRAGATPTARFAISSAHRPSRGPTKPRPVLQPECAALGWG
jgi:hypothetical protein